jgi:hypothetical protein
VYFDRPEPSLFAEIAKISSRTICSTPLRIAVGLTFITRATCRMENLISPVDQSARSKT